MRPRAVHITEDDIQNLTDFKRRELLRAIHVIEQNRIAQGKDPYGGNA
jgi:hypothetical protein